jgi:hypothetical protein
MLLGVQLPAEKRYVLVKYYMLAGLAGYTYGKHILEELQMYIEVFELGKVNFWWLKTIRFA